ncbi:MAG: hypothetical protein ACXIUB_08590 [Wenzhouxiangella sp.]
MSKAINLYPLRLVLGFVLGALICTLLLPNGLNRTPWGEPDAAGQLVVEQRTFWLGGLVVASHRRVYDDQRRLVETTPRSWALAVTGPRLLRLVAHLGLIGLLVVLLIRVPARWTPSSGLPALRDQVRALCATVRSRITAIARSLGQGITAVVVVFLLTVTFGPKPIEYQWTLFEPDRLEQGEQALAMHLEQTGRRGQVERDLSRDGQPILRLVETRFGLIGMLRETAPAPPLHEAVGGSQLTVSFPAPYWMFWLMGVAALLVMFVHRRKSTASPPLA